MKRRRVYLILQTLLCITLTVLLSACALSIYREGVAARAQNPLESIYTPGIVAEKAAPILPLLFAAVGFMIAGLVLGVKDEGAEKAERLPAPQPRAAKPANRERVQAVLIAVAAILILAGMLNGSARDVLYKAITICTECVGFG